ncbi:MAG: NAD-dependent epimerase/dehydratase family protein [Candidatus Micrarchaeota archaeon]
MKVAVAGASGKLGQEVISLLLKKNVHTIAILRAGSKANMPKGAIMRFADYGNSASLKEALHGATHIINLTGSVAAHLGLDKLRAANVQPTKMLLEAAPANLQDFIHISSIAVYGKNLEGECNESCPRNADNAYAKAKLEGERLALSYAGKFRVIILQPGIIYGPQFSEGFFEILRQLQKKKMRIIGSGKNFMPLVHVHDVAQAIFSCLSAKVQSGSTYLLVAQPQLTQKELMEMAAKELGVSPPRKSVNYSIANFLALFEESKARLFGGRAKLTSDMVEQIYCSRKFSCQKAKKELKWSPAVPFKTGIEQVVIEFKSSR